MDLRLRRRRKVRLHLEKGPTVEGFLVGRWGEHYMLVTPSVVEAEDRTHDLEGQLAVPKANVLFIQVLA